MFAYKGMRNKIEHSSMHKQEYHSNMSKNERTGNEQVALDCR
jgi:hypothetical protein